jgi:transposase, IS5 family
MQGKHKHEPQMDMFKTQLKELVSKEHSLVVLSRRIDWGSIDKEFEQYYSKEGRPSVPTRTMVGLLMLKSMFNQADETVIPMWVENPYWQYFCGEQFFRHSPPCDPSDLVHFRKRIKKEGHEYILKVSAGLHGQEIKEEEVTIDSTVQEKDITFPTDAKLAIAILKECWRLADRSALKLHQSYTRKTSQAKLKLRFGNHPKKKKEARRAVKDLQKYARKVIAQLKNHLPTEIIESNKVRFERYDKILSQKKDDKNKIYSLHEPGVYCMSKGKAHKPYEFGCKVSVAVTAKTGIIVGATSFETNKSDVHTLEQTLTQVKYITGKMPKEAICDRGYRGRKKVENTKIVIPNPLPADSSRYQKEKIRKKFRRRAAIEPIIGHLKQDHRMERNFLKGLYGDFVNCVLAAAGFNLRKMLRKIASSWNSIIRWFNSQYYCLFTIKMQSLKLGF